MQGYVAARQSGTLEHTARRLTAECQEEGLPCLLILGTLDGRSDTRIDCIERRCERTLQHIEACLIKEVRGTERATRGAIEHLTTEGGEIVHIEPVMLDMKTIVVDTEQPF